MLVRLISWVGVLKHVHPSNSVWHMIVIFEVIDEVWVWSSNTHIINKEKQQHNNREVHEEVQSSDK